MDIEPVGRCGVCRIALLILCVTLLAGGCAVDTNALLVDVADAAGQSVLESLLDTLSVSLAT